MSKKLAAGLDALVLDVKVGAGAFMKKQVDARRLAQMMVGIGRRMDKRVQALITDMNQPLGYAMGNALEVMEASQTLQNVGPTDLTRLSLELAARMIYLGKITPTLDEARDWPSGNCSTGRGITSSRKSSPRRAVTPRFSTGSNCSPTRREPARSPRRARGFVSAIDAGDIGRASAAIGAGRDTKEDPIDPAVGVILEVKVGEKVEEGGVLCRLYYTSEEP